MTEEVEDNVVQLFVDRNIGIAFTCMDCKHEFQHVVLHGEVKDIPCPACTMCRTVPFKIVPPPDIDDFDAYVCECGCEFFRPLSGNCTQCIRCGEITEPADDSD